MKTTDQQNRLMQHTCGLSNNENRNWFGTSSGCADSVEFEKLVAGGLAEKRNAPSWSGCDVIYHLTERGKQAATASMPKPEPKRKLTRSQQKYQDYLNSECCESS